MYLLPWSFKDSSMEVFGEKQWRGFVFDGFDLNGEVGFKKVK